MMTDDPGTPGDGHWEINIATTARHGTFGTERERPLLDLNYGLGERIQLNYELPWVVVHERRGDSRSGLGNSSLAVKWRFHDAGETAWQVSTYPRVSLRNARSSSARRGLTEDGTTVLVPLEARRAFASFAVNFEVGREFHSRSADEWTGGVVIGHEWSETLEGMAELHAESSAALEHSTVAVNVGARVAVARCGTLLLALGHDLHNTLEGRASVLTYIGWQVAP